MAEYIEREAAKKAIRDAWYSGERYDDVIDHIPAAAVRPAAPGEWIDRGSLSCRCSECGCKSTKESNYCPNCGADMRGPSGTPAPTEKIEAERDA